MVSWSRVTALYVQGFNIRVSTQAALSEAQKKLYRIFCLPRNDEMEVEVITRARRMKLSFINTLTRPSFYRMESWAHHCYEEHARQ
ncbi:hypothetical protein H112_05857 [Trichophyton rubrum D6]|uniref:Uncharacterized protein n=1 Tax=Trichophyton soudanense CBS 452.61 TaxID=1215331 RepID=A0A022XNF5_TRISD|nr:hypothetical protein H100_05872 [Trichophyton rubrum MR850]EZF40148.1 hypothetical protein H102_05841 [Trichophyton rubrum CBS 100081]EZF61377.1 hypothetical protein H104_05854 [Trichophyton rubrum CBS 289.86]EZF72039.1 hypothetical protein H105_05882 [Trichophyton soudanense CBS 452.61]EZF82693.1 hypothetical protein H110_05863 [Trichophyton rubrum MR1448]EZG14901.1 hypothetical protein H107_06003 [Trichophyton rubrum CBS 202.88]KDB31889.1 hypothetical protein H112_05857 [Trichophyton rub